MCVIVLVPSFIIGVTVGSISLISKRLGVEDKAVRHPNGAPMFRSQIPPGSSLWGRAAVDEAH